MGNHNAGRNEGYPQRNFMYLAFAAGMFLLAGVLQFFDDFARRQAVREMMSLAVHFILIGLAIFWCISADGRITSKHLRKLALILGMFIVMFLLLRFVRYKFFKENGTVARYLWYAYYIPQTAIPAVMLCAACCIGNGDKRSTINGLRWLAIPAVVMILLILTNDLHGWAFGFRPNFENFEKDYTHEAVYYLNIGWQLVLSAISVGIIFRKCRIQRCKNRIWMLIAGLAVCVALIVLSFVDLIQAYKTPELFSLFYIFLFECSIQIGLIPSNGNYPHYFAASGISAAVLDDAGRVAFRSDCAAFPFAEDVKNLKDGDISADGNTMVHVQPISGGRVVWTDDLTHINEINAEIREVLDNLSEETDLIRAENELKEQRTKIAETRKLYNEVEIAVYPQMVGIEKIVRTTNVKDADFERKMHTVGILGAYVKRRSNLTVMAEKEKKVRLAEVGLSIKESLTYLTLSGVHCAFAQTGDEDVSIAQALAVYDAFEFAIERVMTTLTDLTAYLGISDGVIGLRLAMEGTRSTRVKPPANMTVTDEDGTVFVDLRVEKGAAV